MLDRTPVIDISKIESIQNAIRSVSTGASTGYKLSLSLEYDSYSQTIESSLLVFVILNHPL